MGSPYFVHQQANRIHVVRSDVGFNRILGVIVKSMGMPDINHVSDYSPEYRVIQDITQSYTAARESNSRSVVFLESRYEWLGWEKFQRVIIFDFSGKKKG